MSFSWNKTWRNYKFAWNSCLGYTRYGEPWTSLEQKRWYHTWYAARNRLVFVTASSLVAAILYMKNALLILQYCKEAHKKRTSFYIIEWMGQIWQSGGVTQKNCKYMQSSEGQVLIYPIYILLVNRIGISKRSTIQNRFEGNKRLVCV